MIKLAPSILSADFARLGEEIKEADTAGCDYIHIDVMDGIFVPNISFAMPVIKAIRSCTNKVFDVHLMIDEPVRYLEDFAEAGANLITVHAEACKHLHYTLKKIGELGMKVGVALNPATPPSVLQYVLEELDMIVVMSVNPGFGGQAYITGMTSKIQEVKTMAQNSGKNISIQVDGGVTIDNVRQIIEAGADCIVAGSAVFGGKVAENIAAFKHVFEEMGG